MFVGAEKLRIERAAQRLGLSVFHALERAIEDLPLFQCLSQRRVACHRLFHLVLVTQGAEKLAAADDGPGERVPETVVGNELVRETAGE